MNFAVLEWMTRCLRCGHEHDHRTQDCDVGLKFEPPRAPRQCENCEEKLLGVRHAYAQTFEVVEVVEGES